MSSPWPTLFEQIALAVRVSVTLGLSLRKAAELVRDTYPVDLAIVNEGSGKLIHCCVWKPPELQPING